MDMMQSGPPGHVASRVAGTTDESGLRRPRIGILSTYVSRAHSGTTQSTINIANALARRANVDVCLLAFSIEPGLLASSIQLRLVREPRPHRLVWRVGRLLLARDFERVFGDALESEGPFDLVYTQYMECAVAFRRRHATPPLVTHFGHVLASQEAREECEMGEPWRSLDIRLASWLERKAYQLPKTTHLASTPLVAETRADAFHLPSSFFRIRPLGIDQSRFSSNHARDEIRKSMGIAPTDVVMVSVARMVAWKQIDWLIRALERLPEHVHLVLVGAGEERSRLEQLTRAQHVQSRVHFTGQADPVPYLAAADIFGLVSRIESFGLVYAEAMLMGLPCIGLRYAPPDVLSSAADVITDGESGYVVPDIDGLTDRWKQLVSDPALRARLGANARRHALAHYTADAYAGFLEAFVPPRPIGLT